MPLRTETIDLESECERLEDEMEDLASRQASMGEDASEEQAQQLLQQGNELNNQRNILQAIQDGGVEGVPALDTVTLAGLTAGEVNLVEDVVEEYPSVRHRDAWVAIGTHDAPYLEHDPEEPLTISGVEESVLAVGDLPLPYVRWAEAKISELSHLSESGGNAYLRLVQDKQAGE